MSVQLRAAAPTIWLLAAAAFPLGCKEAAPPAPPTYAATGGVSWQDGKPLSGGMIQFISQRDPTLNMSSAIGGDGRFSLQTIVGNQNIGGAIEGPCQVLVTLPFAPGDEPEVIVLPQTYDIKAQLNEIAIKIARQPH